MAFGFITVGLSRMHLCLCINMMIFDCADRCFKIRDASPQARLLATLCHLRRQQVPSTVIISKLFTCVPSATFLHAKLPMREIQHDKCFPTSNSPESYFLFGDSMAWPKPPTRQLPIPCPFPNPTCVVWFPVSQGPNA